MAWRLSLAGPSAKVHFLVALSPSPHFLCIVVPLQVLNALSSRSATPVFVPYRDSKLTQLLWDGLKGSGRALMLACLGPLRAQSEESLNTLHFASMARRIKAAPIVLLDPQVSSEGALVNVPTFVMC